MKVKKALTSRVGRIEPDATLKEAAHAMRAEDVGCLLVIEAEHLVGTLTDRDIVVRSLAEGRDPMHLTARDVMSVATVCCYEDQPFEEAVALMREQGLMRLPVLNARDEVVGIVTYMDALSEKPRRKPYKVTFYKDMTGSHGQHKDVPVHTVYVTGVDGKEKAEGEAIKRFESDKHAQPWTTAADGFDVEQPPPKTERPAKG